MAGESCDVPPLQLLQGDNREGVTQHVGVACKWHALFTPDAVVRIPHIGAELAGRDEIRALGERLQALLDYFVQSTDPGTIQLDGDTASGRAYMCELICTRDGESQLNYAIYHDRYQRTGDGWRFTERVYEVRYLDTTPLAGSAPNAAGTGR